MRFLKGIFILLVLSSCGEDSTEPVSQEVLDQAVKAPEIEKLDRFPVQTKWDDLRLRSAPGVKSEVVRQLPEATTLTYIGQKSPFTTKISFKGEWFNQPWVQVETKEGEIGWLYAAGLNQENSDLQKVIFDAQLEQLLGESLADQLWVYQQQFEEGTVSKVFQKGLDIQKGVNDVLNQTSVGDDEKMEEPFWLGSIIPGMVVARKEDNTGYHLLNDYRAWMSEADQRKDTEAQQFFEIMYACHPLDSIESRVGADRMEVDEKSTFSLLSMEVHNQIFKKMSLFIDREPSEPFKSVILDKKEAMVEYLLTPTIHFWYSCKKVESSIQDLVESKYTVLNASDVASIKKLGAKLSAGEVKCNARAGGI